MARVVTPTTERQTRPGAPAEDRPPQRAASAPGRHPGGRLAPGRAVIDRCRPAVDGGALPAKATVDLPLPVTATVFADGHDLLLVWVRHGRPRGRGAADPAERPPGWREQRLELLGNDHWLAWITPPRTGRWDYDLVAVPDEYGSWLRDLRIRHDAGQDIQLELAEGALIAERRRANRRLGPTDRIHLVELVHALRSPSPPAQRLRFAARPATVALMARTADRSAATVAGPFPLWVDRELAGFSAWYELFPRSEGAVPPRGGTFRTAASRLAAVAAMGFDIVYLPPIHPIGVTGRKGPNNTPAAGPDDPGSPWAIGSEAGGHAAVHPDLGTLADFDAFVAEARRTGLEVALDYALQCSPDHPWVREHPEWFRHRPDGSIRCAENPPKRYEDIYPINFDTPDWRRLWEALHDVMEQWIGRGVRVFRVDNPHTKPLAFWQWLIERVRQRHPDVLFLAEAFTRPAMMQRLAKIGFTQSYTYFTWRNTKQELSDYLTELSQGDQVDWFRPSFWVNTPDILHATLQTGGPPAFRLRAVLAALTCPSWGMYSGYELYENQPVREGSEEYLRSEKYELRPRRWDTGESMAPLITRLNAIRRRHREAIAQLRTLRLHHVDSHSMLCVSRMSADRRDVLLVVVNLDPSSVREATTWLDLPALGMPDDRPFEAHDEMDGSTYTWRGPANYVRLDPAVTPAHVLHLRAT